MSLDSLLTTVVATEALESAPGHGPPAHHDCLDCGAALTDRFCAHCGQPADTHRITLKGLLLHDLPHSVWHVDKGLIYTFWQMLTRPGLTIRGYLAGQRTRQFRPISYMLLLVGLSALLMSAFQPALLKAMVSGQPGQPAAALMSIVMERYLTTNLGHPALVQIIMLPLNTLAAWLLLRRKGYNFAELLLANAFVSGTLTIINMAIMLPALLFASPASIRVFSLLGFIPTVLYSLWVNAQLLLAAPLSTARRYGRALSIALLQMLLLVLAATAFMVILVVQVLHERPELAPKKPRTAATH